MRTISWGILVAAVAGCAGEAVEFEHVSELEVNTRGLAIYPEGTDAQVSMYGTTCRVRIQDATIGQDVDFPSDEEEVQDAGLVFGEPAFVVVTPDAVHLNFPDRGWDWTASDLDLTGVVQARITDSGVVALSDGCVVTRIEGEDRFDVDLGPGLTCADAGFSVSGDGDAFVATGTEVIRVEDDGASALGYAADLAVWDDVAEVLYVATLGGSTVTGLEADGAVRWSLEVDGGIVSVDAMGALGSAAVVVERANGTGELVVIDGFSGTVTSDLMTPTPAQEVRGSEDGGTLAMILPREIHFFRVNAAR